MEKHGPSPRPRPNVSHYPKKGEFNNRFGHKPARNNAKNEPSPHIEPWTRHELLEALKHAVPDSAQREAFVLPAYLCLQKTNPELHKAFLQDVLPSLVRELHTLFHHGAPKALATLSELKHLEHASPNVEYKNERWATFLEVLPKYIAQFKQNQALMSANLGHPASESKIVPPPQKEFKEALMEKLKGTHRYWPTFGSDTSPDSPAPSPAPSQ